MKKPDDARDFRVGDRVTLSLSAGRVVDDVVKLLSIARMAAGCKWTSGEMRPRWSICGRCAR